MRIWLCKGSYGGRIGRKLTENMAMICANKNRVEPIREGRMVAIVYDMPVQMTTI
jgi:hypothetical protein